MDTAAGREISVVEISWLAALTSDVTDDSGDASAASSPPLQRSTHGLAAGTAHAPRPKRKTFVYVQFRRAVTCDS